MKYLYNFGIEHLDKINDIEGAGTDGRRRGARVHPRQADRARHRLATLVAVTVPRDQEAGPDAAHDGPKTAGRDGSAGEPSVDFDRADDDRSLRDIARGASGYRSVPRPLRATRAASKAALEP